MPFPIIKNIGCHLNSQLNDNLLLHTKSISSCHFCKLPFDCFRFGQTLANYLDDIFKI
jgi:hypothetical protein